MKKIINLKEEDVTLDTKDIHQVGLILNKENPEDIYYSINIDCGTFGNAIGHYKDQVIANVILAELKTFLFESDADGTVVKEDDQDVQ